MHNFGTSLSSVGRLQIVHIDSRNSNLCKKNQFHSTFDLSWVLPSIQQSTLTWKIIWLSFDLEIWHFAFWLGCIRDIGKLMSMPMEKSSRHCDGDCTECCECYGMWLATMKRQCSNNNSLHSFNVQTQHLDKLSKPTHNPHSLHEVHPSTHYLCCGLLHSHHKISMSSLWIASDDIWVMRLLLHLVQFHLSYLLYISIPLSTRVREKKKHGFSYIGYTKRWQCYHIFPMVEEAHIYNADGFKLLNTGFVKTIESPFRKECNWIALLVPRLDSASSLAASNFLQCPTIGHETSNHVYLIVIRSIPISTCRFFVKSFTGKTTTSHHLIMLWHNYWLILPPNPNPNSCTIWSFLQTTNDFNPQRF